MSEVLSTYAKAAKGHQINAFKFADRLHVTDSSAAEPEANLVNSDSVETQTDTNSPSDPTDSRLCSGTSVPDSERLISGSVYNESKLSCWYDFTSTPGGLLFLQTVLYPNSPWALRTPRIRLYCRDLIRLLVAELPAVFAWKEVQEVAESEEKSGNSGSIIDPDRAKSILDELKTDVKEKKNILFHINLVAGEPTWTWGRIFVEEAGKMHREKFCDELNLCTLLKTSAKLNTKENSQLGR